MLQEVQATVDQAAQQVDQEVLAVTLITVQCSKVLSHQHTVGLQSQHREADLTVLTVIEKAHTVDHRHQRKLAVLAHPSLQEASIQVV